MMVAYWPGLVSAAVAPRWSLLAIGLPAISWLDPRRLSTAALVGLSFGITHAALTVIAMPAGSGRLTGTLELYHLLIFGAAILAGAGLSSLDGVMKGAGAGMAICSGIAIAQMFGWDGITQAAVPAALFFNRDILAETAAILVVWGLFRPVYWVAAAGAVPLALCQSRTALLMFGVPFAWWLLRKAPRNTIPALLLLGLGLGGVALWFSIGPGKIASVSERLMAWSECLHRLSAWGYGLGSFTEAFPRMEYAHSDILQAASELGLGTLFFVAPFVVAFRGRSDTEAEPLALIAGTVCLAVAFPLHMPASTLLIGLLVGFLARRREPLRMARHERRDFVGAVA